MSVTTAREYTWLAGIAAGCERLVHPDVADTRERQHQQRLVGVALAAPFVIAAALAQTLNGIYAGASLLAIICGVFAVFWMLGCSVVVSGKRGIAEPVLFTLAAIAVAIIIAAGGGAGQPIALLAAGLAFEAYWIDRTTKGGSIGAFAGVVAVPLSFVAGPHLFSTAAMPSVWMWVVPALYAATVAVRAVDLARSKQAVTHRPGISEIANLFGRAALRLTASGEISEASDEAGALFGQPSALLVGRSMFERIHVADRVAFMSALAELEADGERKGLDLKLRTSAGGNVDGGAERFMPVTAELRRDGPETDGVAVLIHDNSELDRLRDEVETAKQIADSTEIAKSRFLAAVSHELRTPLNAIIGFSDMMLHNMTGELADQQREYVGLISHSGNHLLSVVNAILDVSKIESGAYSIRPEPFAAIEAIELCQSMMAHQAENQQLSLTVSVRPEVREITADRRAVQQIVINLLSNAIKFTPSGGSVSLDVFRKGDSLNVVVADNGIGIATDDLGKLGRPFTQIRNDITRQYEGTGLGLSLVKGLVALHEGTMAIESAPGEGTTVTVALPIDGPKTMESGSGETKTTPAKVHEMDLRVRYETVRKTA